jgi:molecular chaperone GrpE
MERPMKEEENSAQDDRSRADDRSGEEGDALPAEELAPEQEGARVKSDAQVLQEEISLLEGQLQDMRNRYLRAVADLDNARKRARREMADAQLQAVADVLLELLPVVDNFERALETTEPAPGATDGTRAIHEGVALIYRQLMDMLAGRGVEAIEAMGQPFDPVLHEAVAQVPAGGEQEEGTVALELQKGYRLGKRVLRPSKVGVAIGEGEKNRNSQESGEAG